MSLRIEPREQIPNDKLSEIFKRRKFGKVEFISSFIAPKNATKITRIMRSLGFELQ